MKIDNILKYHMFDPNGKGINLLTGAGFSVYAQNKAQKRLYVASELVKKIKEEILPKCNNTLSKNKTLAKQSEKLSEICTFLGEDKTILDTYLQNLYSVGSYEDFYDIIPKINIKNIITTNIDDLLENVYRETSVSLIISLETHIPVEQNFVRYYKLHGDVGKYSEKNHRFSFSIGEIDIVPATKPDAFRWFREHIIYQKDSPLVIIGNSVTDDTIRQQLFTFPPAPENPLCPIVYIDNNTSSCDRFQALFPNFNITTYCMDTRDFFLNFSDEAYIPPTINTQKNTNLVSEFLLSNIIQKEKEHIKGATIQDIYLGKQVGLFEQSLEFIKTRYVTDVINQILDKKNAIITGFPCCGKTYLLKQIAMELDRLYSMQVYYIDGINYIDEKQFKNLIASINTPRSVIFLIDNVTYIDHFPIVDILSEHKILWIVADLWQSWGSNHLSKNYQSTYHEVVSTLVEEDQQKYRKFLQKYIAPQVPWVTEKGLQKIHSIQNGVSRYVTDQYRRSIENCLKNLDDDALNLLIAIMYMTLCKTKFSEDLITRVIDSYNKEKFDHINNQLNVLIEYHYSKWNRTGYYQFYQNDYFVAKIFFSIITEDYFEKQEQIVGILNKTSPFRIPNYKAFSRQCRKSETLEALFVWNHEKAEKHVNELLDISRDQNQTAHTHHQYAIYLNELLDKYNSKKRIAGHKAPDDIDIPLIKEKCITYIKNSYELAQHDFSIKNTYARLIFDFNYKALDQDKENKIRKLFECLDILKNCIEYENIRLADKHIQEYCKRVLDLARHPDTSERVSLIIHKKTAKNVCEAEKKNDFPNFINNSLYRFEFSKLADEILNL